MLVSSTTLFGPAATCMLGGSQPGPHCEFGNARPAKPADASVGVSVNAIVASDGSSGSDCIGSRRGLALAVGEGIGDAP